MEQFPKQLALSVQDLAMTSVAQLAGCHPAQWKVTTVSVPGQDTRLGFRSPAGACERGNWSMFLSHINTSLPLFLPPFPYL